MNSLSFDSHDGPENPTVADLSNLVVRPIRPGEADRWVSLMAEHHYLGFRQLVGESLKYVALLNGEWVALLGWANAAFKCGPRDQWVGWTREQQWRRLRYLVNNQRFLILPGWRVRNLASKVLAANLRRLSRDWEAVYNHPVLLVETFVDSSRFAGTSYHAAGWLKLGETQGYGRNAGKYFYHGHPKTLWVKPLHREARKWLAADFDVPALQGGGSEVMVDLNTVALEAPGGLLERLNDLPDPRKRRGIRHRQTSILAVAACACVAGARSFAAIAEWAADLSQDVLGRLGCRWHGEKRRHIAPSEPTIRRTLQTIDADRFDQILGDWLADQCDSEAVAVDGKTLRGSGHGKGKPVHLMAALLHKEGVVIAQRAVEIKSNEITAFQPLLEPVDLRDKVVTADALHAQTEHARYLKEKKGADFVFTVKGNQQTVLEAIQDIDQKDFSPSGPGSKQGSWPERNPDDPD